MSRLDSTICGDANPNGNISFRFKGSCGKPVPFKDAYRCTGCGGFFHRDCIFEHFEKEEGHSVAHNALRKIKDQMDRAFTTNTEIGWSKIRQWCDEGLSREFQRKSLLPF